MGKEEIRRQMITKRNGISQVEYVRYNYGILEQLEKLSEYTQADVILSYVSFGNEVDTHALIQNALHSLKKIAVPKVLSKGKIEFYEIKNLEELKRSKFGILEPVSEVPISYKESLRYVMIMPGLAFDEELHRIGYGGGYYDRYLEQHQDKHISTIALAYDFQVHDKISSEAFDYQPNILITPSKVLFAV